MKVEYTDVSDTRKSLSVEIPPDVVEHEVERVTRDYARSLKLPGFRPGKVPTRVVRQRFKQQILHEVAHDLIPRAVDDALRERGVEPVDTPDVKDVSIDEGRPLTFTAAIETAPPIDPGALDTITLRRPPVTVDTADIDRTLERLRDAQARFEPVDGSRRHYRRHAGGRYDAAEARERRRGGRPGAGGALRRGRRNRRRGESAGIRRSGDRASASAIRRRSASRFRPTIRSRTWPAPRSSTRSR